MLPQSLEAGTIRMMSPGSVAREVFGDDFVDHFGGTREHEVGLWNSAVTNWEGIVVYFGCFLSLWLTNISGTVPGACVTVFVSTNAIRFWHTGVVGTPSVRSVVVCTHRRKFSPSVVTLFPTRKSLTRIDRSSNAKFSTGVAWALPLDCI